MNRVHPTTGITQSSEFRLFVIAVLVFAVMGFLSPDRFLSAQNLTSMAFQFPEFAILALAVTITMMTGGIDLSIVGIANLSAIIAALILTGFADPSAHSLFWLGVAFLAAMATGIVAGLVNGSLVAYFGLPPILATLGTGLVYTGFAIAMTGGSAVMGFPGSVAWLGNQQILGIPVPLILFVMLAGLLHFVLTRTAFGIRVAMFGANPLAAVYAAIDVNRMILKVYAISGIFASIAGLIVMSRANSAKADYGSSYLLLAVLIAVLGGINPYGGRGKVIGVIFAVLAMQFLSSGLNMLQFSNFARELIWGALLIFVMIVNTNAWTGILLPLTRANKTR